MKIVTKMATYLKGIAIFCLAIIPVSLCYDDIDAFMTGDQIRQIFHADSGSVPLHEVVEINFPVRNKRDLLPAGTRITIRAFGEDIQLWLHPNERVLLGENTPVYWARRGFGASKNVQFIREYDMLEGVGFLLEDPEHLASLVIGTENTGAARVTGHIGKKRLAIKPLPRGVVTEYLRKRRSIDNFDSSNSTFHVVYKTNENFEQNHSIAAVDQTILQERMARTTHQISSILYPELLIFVDHSTYMIEGSDPNGFMEYLLAYWNGVDLKYRTLETPKVRLHVSALVIGLDPPATPYIANHMLSRTTFHFERSLNESKSFFYNIKESFPLSSYDIAITMTRLEIGGLEGVKIVGMANAGGACRVDENAKSMKAVVFCHDDGAFDGVHAIAHELGHSIGLDHDNATENCLFTDGYIMAYTPVYTKNSTAFSTCSIEELQSQLDNENLTCLYNEPQIFGKDMPKLMPGKLKNLEAQCRAGGHGLPCNVTTVDVCVNYHCHDANGECKPTGFAALDGTQCGNANDVPPKFCLKNQCVHL